MTPAATLSAMPADTPNELSPAKVRVGLAIIAVVLVVALVMMAVVDSTLGRAIMFGVIVLVLLRAYLLYRSLRREQRPPA